MDHLRAAPILALFLFVSAGACGGQVTVSPDKDGGADAPPSGCPAAPPSAGSPCPSYGLTCDYCPVGGNMAICSHDGWAFAGVICAPDAGPDVPPSGGCPATLPMSGSCSPVGLVCGYGDDPRPGCRPRAECTPSGWMSGVGTCPPPPTDKCPASAAEADGKACSTVGAFCTYPDRNCGCGDCFGGPCGGEPRWACDPKNPDPACPTKMPNLGVPCPKEGTRCDYGTCSAGSADGRDCKGGVWVERAIMCPE